MNELRWSMGGHSRSVGRSIAFVWILTSLSKPIWGGLSDARVHIGGRRNRGGGGLWWEACSNVPNNLQTDGKCILHPLFAQENPDENP